MAICIPCERQKALQQAKLPLLRELAQKRAKESNEYYTIYFDTEDKKYRITTETNAKSEGYTVVEIIPPY